MWDGRRREKAALRRQTRFNSNGVMGIRGAKETIYHIDKRQRYEEIERGKVRGIQRRPSRILEIWSSFDESASGVDGCIDSTKWVTY